MIDGLKLAAWIATLLGAMAFGIPILVLGMLLFFEKVWWPYSLWLLTLLK